MVPLAAAVVVWPMLFVVPGWSLVAALRPRIDAAGRLGLAVVCSVAISTHLVYWASHLAGGYSRVVVFAVAAVLAAPIVITAWRGVRPPPPRSLAAAGPGLVVAGAAAVLVGVTLAMGLWRETPAGVISGGTNWSDFGVHLSIAETLNSGGNFPPEVPYFAGAPLVYHWFADFHAAILAEAVHLFSPPVMVIQSAVLAAALALLVYSLARRLVRLDGRRVGAIAAALVAFGGGLGYVRLIGDVTAGAGDPLELIGRTSYDNQWLTEWPYFRIPSVMGTGLLAHRATTAGLPMLVGAILLLVAALPNARDLAAGWRDRPAVLAGAGLLGALLAPFHFFFLPAFPLVALAWTVLGGRLLDRDAPRNAAMLLAPYLLAVPFALAIVTQASGSGAVQLVALWPSSPRDDGPLAVAFFYLTNLGVPFLLALVALVTPGLGRRAFLATWIIGLFVVPNVIQVSTVDFDMNKYFQAMWIGVAIAAAWLIRRWPLPAVVAVFALSIPSPLLVAAWTATSTTQAISNTDLAAARWIAANTPPGSVFVTDGWVNSLTDAAGRKRLTTFGPYIANLGFDPDQRIADVARIYCGGDPTLSAELMRRHGATHVLDGGRPQPCPGPVDFATSAEFTLLYEAGPRIWALVDP
jgi:hypothetical protein